MSAESPTDSSFDNTPYDIVTDDNGNVVAPDAYDEHGEVYDFTYDKKPAAKTRAALANTAQLAFDFDAKEPDGPSVRLDERYAVLNAMKQRYADYAEAIGFMKATTIPKERKELKRKYANLDLMAKDKLARAKYTGSYEREVLMPLLKTDELLAVGFPAADVEEVEQQTIHSIRNNFGHKVGHTTRDRNMKRVFKPDSKDD